MEKIGNVSLDTTYYPGEDLYSDGAVEDKILELVKKYPQEEYNKVIAREQDWAVMYHLAHERENIISWYPFEKGAKVLEIGSGCGAITGAVAAQADSVTCIDLSMKRSTINAVRNQKRNNIKICVGNFQDIEKDLDEDFDYATLIGVFEYGRGYIGGEKPYHGFLTTIMNHIKPGGKLLIAIENKFGLKYWAGCTEDHVGKFFEGLEGYQNMEGVRTFTKPELIRIMEECGYQNYRFYYPYPDYKFPTVIYSDEHLPKNGELVRNICNFDRKRLVLMDEGKVFDQILADGLFPLYSNSFFVEITRDGLEEVTCIGETNVENSDTKNIMPEQLIYTKYSSGRAPEFAIQTRIVNSGNKQLSGDSKGEDEKSLQTGIANSGNKQLSGDSKGEDEKPLQSGISNSNGQTSQGWIYKREDEPRQFPIDDGKNKKRLIYKTAEYPAGQEHILRIAEIKDRLEEFWKKNGLFQVNQCRLEGDRIYFEYLEGVTLEEELDRLVEQGETKQAENRIKQAVQNILDAADTENFKLTPEFEQVFGTVSFPEQEQAVKVADIDLIFSNMLLTQDGSLHILDYEWTFFFPVPVGYIAYRALHYYLESASKRSILKENFDFYGYFGIIPDKQKIYEAMEKQFQHYISGSYVSTGALYHTMGKKALPLGELLADADQRRIQVYLDYGQGFSEENSYFIEHGYDEDIQCTITIPEHAVGVWIDPALRACVIRDLKLEWLDETAGDLSEKSTGAMLVSCTTTGFELEKNCYLFDNSDPKIIIEEIPPGKRQIGISYHISILEEETAVLLMDKVNTRGRMKKKVRGLIKG